jgi:hypothetical protein
MGQLTIPQEIRDVLSLDEQTGADVESAMRPWGASGVESNSAGVTVKALPGFCAKRRKGL